MQRASDQHRKEEPKEAGREQQQAVDQLRKALEEIERILAQLRDEQREELLAALEARFREILERHRPITASTVDLEKVRGERSWTRADRLRLADIGGEEKTLAGLVEIARQILVEDGTTVVFPKIVEQLRDDMLTVHRLLGEEQTGPYTQAMERDIEQTLEELIAALQRAQREQQQARQGQGQGQQGQQPLPPLVPDSAELKLLRSAQVRVNDRTKSFDGARPQGPLGPEMKGQVRKIADRQEDVRRMAEDMLKRY
jgi:hypothetical protein